jgi:uncharacterized protein HemX
MSDEIKTPQTPEEPQVPETSAAPAEPPKEFNQKKKKALLTYMTILFVVAFLLVLLSFLIQLRDSRATISELNESSNNALKNAQMLQAANEQLTEENDKLEEKLADFEEGNAQLTEELEEAQTQAEQILKVYDALAQADLAIRAKDDAAFTAAAEIIAEQEDILSEDAAELWEILKAQHAAMTAETQE